MKQMLKNIKYFLQSKWRKFIVKQYSKFSTEQPVEELAVSILNKAIACNDCLLQGKCVECGCDFVDMVVYSDKKCKKWN